MTHILTHNDLDGYAAGYVILNTLGKENCKIKHYNYDREPELDDVKAGDTVFITDYSLNYDQYRHILDVIGPTGKLVWCDHHITAINAYNTYDLHLYGLHSTKYCGAVLTWCYINNIQLDIIENTPYCEFIETIPMYLRYVDAWDTWKLNSPYYLDASKINLAVCNRLSMDILDDVVKCPESYIKLGAIYMEYRDDWCKQLRSKYIYTLDLDGGIFDGPDIVKAAVLNCGCSNSTYFGEYIDTCDVCITMCYNGKNWICSFYSNKDYIDCSRAAKSFGGGGHKGAAGCTIADISDLL